jgi:hypothetical protein
MVAIGWRVRGGLVVCAAVVGAFVAVLAGGAAQADLLSTAPGSSAGRAFPPSVSFVGLDQRTALSTGRLRVRVGAPHRGSVRLFAVAGALDGGAVEAVAAPITVWFPHRGGATIALRLTPAGRRLLAGCNGARATALAVPAGGAPVLATGLLRTDSDQCRFINSARLDLSGADHCEILAVGNCLFPWPSDRFTVRDPTTPTGRRIALPAEAMPRNASGAPIDPTDYNRADGFSPGQLIVTKVPGVDTPAALQRTGAVPVTDIGQSFTPDQPIVVINARTGRRQPIWSEIDSTATSPDKTALLIHPAANFEEGGHYIVALRRLRDANGNLIPPTRIFQLYRDRLITVHPAVEGRRPHMERIFHRLAESGIARHDLSLAWDFTVASGRSLAGRMLAIRDDAFRQLGDTRLDDLTVQGDSPKFTVTGVQDFTPAQNTNIARRVTGTVTVPCYLDQPGCPPGSRFHFAHPADEVPSQIPGNTIDANFICNIPRAAMTGASARPLLYGHGLLGSASEINAGAFQLSAQENDIVFCATDEIGMASQDVPNVVSTLQNLSGFPSVADRLQQGFVNALYLGRAMIHPQGFSSNLAFLAPGGKPMIDSTRLFYNGNSQGGILGGALTALAPDYDRAVLGVPGMNYSTLLTRSVDFDPFSAVLYPSYPDELQRPLDLSLTQMLWDRGEADGYAEHLVRNPYPNTPRHSVLLLESFGDHQVTNVATEVEARTIGASVRTPTLDPGRSADVAPFFGIPTIGSFPFSGRAALEVWDIGPLRANGTLGTPTPPTTNTPNRLGRDPHGALGGEPLARTQVSQFLRIGGNLIDVCGAHPCYTAGWTGPGP